MTTALHPREDTGLAGRLARSAAQRTSGAGPRTAQVAEWLAERRAAHRFAVTRIPFADLEGWSFRPDTGDLGHRSGRFFTVEGLSAVVGEDPGVRWEQPIIRQPEVGILGILAKEFDGVLHFLMQAKMEPGNPNLLQLSPTVQATRSNYTKVHKGAAVKYIDHFVRPGRGRVLADVLQSEHGSWFLHKSNRNMLVETDEDVADDPDFAWLTLGQIGELLHGDNLVNMDARTVLACTPVAFPERSAQLSDTMLHSWFTGERSRHDLRTAAVPLRSVAGWEQDPWAIRRPDGRFFQVVSVGVEAGSREVGSWTQPMFEPTGRGVIAFVVRRFDGVPHLLAHARVEGGFLDTVEIGPTVQCVPDNHPVLGSAGRPPFLDLVLEAKPEQVLYEAVHSEEGGRFLNAESRCLIVQPEAPVEDELPPGYCWLTPGQLASLARHGHYVNVQARTLLSCMTTGAVTW
ncbi:NDP-hexose 2,3-dehydratase family protein [Actinacidiphila bryophytorum]|uniref:dTDP-4-dehydro-6-deoxy-alpha-D-glucopyranose 2,3-dehydratase n=1 Tax=Actinacidiphila bryophytorum TaxID=1436133 RepID=A0A9W4H8D1_9ACTN|nr:NDP-hexose 2,3-dehydratase family protein [Actinacidiphila bryophytorum]MBM9438244.1 NDP-hexose 2,3-dehydratase family protein [Actinacidiphila bryophytorum]MBN6542970.1 NDP-hexose 2,3-dehydratase family protein [Actinacidiphila bryophytorum]CAG7657743.1 dTDP-4-dehydro-6-deoxy-alpha-D-glucopyranose 2,3-dehydratase [Actinacidiphila bryophytorum]